MPTMPTRTRARELSTIHIDGWRECLTGTSADAARLLDGKPRWAAVERWGTLDGRMVERAAYPAELYRTEAKAYERADQVCSPARGSERKFDFREGRFVDDIYGRMDQLYDAGTEMGFAPGTGYGFYRESADQDGVERVYRSTEVVRLSPDDVEALLMKWARSKDHGGQTNGERFARAVLGVESPAR